MPRLKWLRSCYGVTLFLAVTLLAGCNPNEIQSALDPQAPVAELQMSLLTYTMYWSILVLLGVGGALTYAIVKFRRKPGDDTIPAQTHGNARVEIGLILVATVITVAVIIPAIRVNFQTGIRVEPGSDPAINDVVINVTGYQWWWDFEYEGEGVTTANEIHVPRGSRVVLNLSSGDVLHSFWVPKLAGKRDLIPNQDNQLWFTTTEETPLGMYYGECAELCLGAHAYMRMRVIVDTPEDYETWLESFKEIPTLLQVNQAQTPSDPLAAQGQQLFKQKGCGACHAVRGYAGGAPDKPDLTNFGLRNSLAAGVLDNTPENLARWLRDPQEVKPGNYMPTLWSEDDPNREEEIAAIVAYLESLGTEEAQQAALNGGNNGN